MRADVIERNIKRAKYNNEEYIGQKYNSLTIIGFEHRKSSWYWKCRCECGKEIVCSPLKAITGHTKSCGCKKIERCHEMTVKYRTTHGGRNERLYHIWHGVKQRCCSSTSKDYANYGGRGIAVCGEWKDSYSAFREWAYNSGYEENLTIDRIDVNGNYEPSNCRWVPIEEQAKNKRNSIIVEIGGEKKCLVDWCEYYGVNYQTAYSHVVRLGESPKEFFKRYRKKYNE